MTRRTTIDLTVTAVTDLHAGSGFGGAGIDAVLERDRRGLPTVRWTHFLGLLQQALVDREQALGRSPGDLEQLLHDLFATPGGSTKRRSRGLVRGTSLRVPEERPVRSRILGSSAREQGTRVPRDDTLRRLEYIPAGTVLCGKIQIPSGLQLDAVSGEDESARALLEKLLKRVDCLGKNRTRGDGRIHVKMDFRDGAGDRGNDFRITGEPETKTGWQHYRVAFHALDPVCLAVTQAAGNVLPSASFISPAGTFGMLANAALESSPTIADLLFAGDVETGASYPLGAVEFTIDRADCVPIPLSYQTEKPPPQQDPWPWWMDNPATPVPQDVLSIRPGEKLKRPSPHCYLVTVDGGATWRRHEVELAIRLRNNAGELRRGLRSEKALFSQEEVPEDTVFLATLRVRSAAVKEFEKWLEDMMRSGTWLCAGHGGAPVRIEQAARLPAPGFAEVGTDPSKDIRLFVETDLIARRTAQDFHAQLDAGCLKSLLRAAGIAEDYANAIESVTPTSEATAVYGFNAMTKKRRLPALAIRRGSVAILSLAEPTAAAGLRSELARRQGEGIGERCAEGYGRFRIDFAPTVAECQATVPAGAFPHGEQLLEGVARLLEKHRECLAHARKHGFSTARLQGLRLALADDGMFKDWLRAAERSVEKANSSSGRNLVKEIRERRENAKQDLERWPDALPELERFALEAAKAVQRNGGDRR